MKKSLSYTLLLTALLVPGVLSAHAGHVHAETIAAGDTYTVINISPGDFIITSPITTATASSSFPTTGQDCESYINGYMKIGAKNTESDVRSLQIFLNKYQNAGLPITGYFGPLTKAAVMKYQLANGIYTSGIVLTQTRWSINDKMCPNLHFPKPVI